MKIVADQHIPCLPNIINSKYSFISLPTTELIKENLTQADILLCRSVTRVDAKLLAQTPVKFVATASSGYDNLDVDWLNQQKITWAHAPGCNATAVAEYVVSALVTLENQGILTLSTHLQAGVIGVGHVGHRVAKMLEILGFSVLLNDPPREERELNFSSTPLSAFSNLDLICLHTPLTHTGKYPTHHLLNRKLIQQLKPGCVVISAGRGAVVNTNDMLTYGQHLIWCVDVYENEPTINPQALAQAQIATPHIAGHSIQAKWRGAHMIVSALYQFLGEPPPTSLTYPNTQLSANDKPLTWQQIIATVYDPLKETTVLKHFPKKFIQLRNNYPPRYEFAYVTLLKESFQPTDQALLTQLNFKYSRFN